MEIAGSERFSNQVSQAVLLLKTRGTKAYAILTNYVGRIQKGVPRTVFVQYLAHSSVSVARDSDTVHHVCETARAKYYKTRHRPLPFEEVILGKSNTISAHG
jgi:hypothetical protein